MGSPLNKNFRVISSCLLVLYTSVSLHNHYIPTWDTPVDADKYPQYPIDLPAEFSQKLAAEFSPNKVYDTSSNDSFLGNVRMIISLADSKMISYCYILPGLFFFPLLLSLAIDRFGIKVFAQNPNTHLSLARKIFLVSCCIGMIVYPAFRKYLFSFLSHRIKYRFLSFITYKMLHKKIYFLQAQQLDRLIAQLESSMKGLYEDTSFLASVIGTAAPVFQIVQAAFQLLLCDTESRRLYHEEEVEPLHYFAVTVDRNAIERSEHGRPLDVSSAEKKMKKFARIYLLLYILAGLIVTIGVLNFKANLYAKQEKILNAQYLEGIGETLANINTILYNDKLPSAYFHLNSCLEGIFHERCLGSLVRAFLEVYWCFLPVALVLFVRRCENIESLYVTSLYRASENTRAGKDLLQAAFTISLGLGVFGMFGMPNIRSRAYITFSLCGIAGKILSGLIQSPAFLNSGFSIPFTAFFPGAIDHATRVVMDLGYRAFWLLAGSSDFPLCNMLGKKLSEEYMGYFTHNICNDYYYEGEELEQNPAVLPIKIRGVSYQYPEIGDFTIFGYTKQEDGLEMQIEEDEEKAAAALDAGKETKKLIKLHKKGEGATRKNGLRVLYGVNLTLEPGKSYIIRGPNGCGKSTLAYLLSGQDRDYSGMVSRGKNELKDAPLSSWIERLRIFLQNTPLLPGTIIKNLEVFIPNNMQVSQGTLINLLEELDIWEDINMRPDGLQSVLSTGSSLSGGQAQKLRMFSALVNSPEYREDSPSLMIFDEATSAMSPEAEAHTIQLVKKYIIRHGKAIVLWIQHTADPDILGQFDYVIEMDRGRVTGVYNTGDYNIEVDPITKKISYIPKW